MFGLAEGGRLLMYVGTDARQSVLAALAALGINYEPESGDTEFCIAAANHFLRTVMLRAGAAPKSFNDHDAFVGGLFGFAFANLLTGIVGGQF